MLHNTQQYPKVGTDLQTLPDAGNGDLSGQVTTLKIVPCPICRATYRPSDEQIARGSTYLLETAFLGICRFCFRCQRPACPQCWNPIHHTCASCSEEAHLPFRTPVPSLEGLIFLPSISIHARPENNIAFICQRNGRFYTPEPTPTHSMRREHHIVQSAPAISEPVTSGALPIQPNNAIPAQAPREIDHYPTWLQEVLGQKTDEPSVQSTNGGEPAKNSATSYAQAEPAVSTQPHMHAHNWQQMAPMAQAPTVPSAPTSPAAFTGQPLAPAVPAPTAEYQSEPTFEEDTGDESSLFERVENTLIVITSILLLAVVLMIVLSILSVQVNTFLLHLLHIDIRTEIAYLLQLR
ncbi:MAG TPA: hypothetical protein VGM01_08035 [Ktedonobacteraceae bacterium]